MNKTNKNIFNVLLAICFLLVLHGCATINGNENTRIVGIILILILGLVLFIRGGIKLNKKRDSK